MSSLNLLFPLLCSCTQSTETLIGYSLTASLPAVLLLKQAPTAKLSFHQKESNLIYTQIPAEIFHVFQLGILVGGFQHVDLLIPLRFCKNLTRLRILLIFLF